MGFKPFKIDDSINASGVLKPYCAQGLYRLKVTGIECSPLDLPEGKNDYWLWLFQITAGPSGVGRIFPQYGIWKAERQFGNGRILNTLGFDAKSLAGRSIPDYATFQKIALAVAKKVEGKELGALIGDGEPYNGRPSSDILEFLTLDDLKARGGPQAMGVSTPTGGRNGAVPAASATAVAEVADDLFGDDAEDDLNV